MPHHVDVHVGHRVRQRRWMLGLTQSQLAGRVGIRFQQVQKYETGENRMSASRLWDVAGALRVPVTFFYDGLEGGVSEARGAKAQSAALPDREAIDLVRAFHAMPQVQRRHLFDLARALGQAD
ncbi:MAG TPA: helix-turn-helix transcriptional regulator [Thermohalobaculum sp.]|nr:helix-turn-helix transcriptional regulator [Thermohalobaculum sp.]